MERIVHRLFAPEAGTEYHAQHAVDRRQLLAWAAGGAALAGFAPGPVARRAAATAATPSSASHAAPASSPAGWQTWLLDSPDELRPAAPSDPTADEMDEVLALQEQRTDQTLATIQKWGSRPAVLPWTELANAAYAEFKLPPIRQYRANGLLQTAMYDASVAAYEAQDAYDAPVPAAGDSQITPVAGLGTDRPAFPSAEAAVAGAAAAILSALLPDAAPKRFTDLAAEAAMSRLQAGLNFRRDIDAGLALGQAIGERAIALAADDQPAFGLGRQWTPHGTRLLGADPSWLRGSTPRTASRGLASLGPGARRSVPARRTAGL